MSNSAGWSVAPLWNSIHHENCIVTMDKMQPNSVSLVVTSPPYCAGKSYEKSVKISEYMEMMSNVFGAMSRILKPGGYAVVNFGDYFNSGNRFYAADVPSCFPASINYFQWGVVRAGFDLQATRIWRKRFAKMGIPFVCNTHPRPIFDYEHVWTFRKRNGDKAEFVNDRKITQRGVIGENWSSPAGIAKHCAAFPIELPEWAIDAYMDKNDDDGIVYDPFAGSGTTCVAAIKKNRRWVGSETNFEYWKIANERIMEAYANRESE